jgi:hypothetical protein
VILSQLAQLWLFLLKNWLRGLAFQDSPYCHIKPARGTTLRPVQYSKRLPGTTGEYPPDNINCL